MGLAAGAASGVAVAATLDCWTGATGAGAGAAVDEKEKTKK